MLLRICLLYTSNGTASASHAKAVVGTEITLTATPNKGYHFKEWQVISGCLPCAAAGHPDDVQVYAGGRCETPAAVQALPEGVPRQPGQFRILQSPVQESV